MKRAFGVLLVLTMVTTACSSNNSPSAASGVR